MWALALLDYGKIWLERNRRVFESKCFKTEVVVNSIVWMVSRWANCTKEFTNISLQDMYRTWVSLLQAAKKEKSVVTSKWVQPPIGLLKLNLKVDFKGNESGWQGWGDKGLHG